MSGSNLHSTVVSEFGGGRIVILLLLFALALYQFVNAGFSMFAVICIVPALVLAIIIVFKNRMVVFWTLVILNFFLQWHSMPLPQGIPMSLYNEGLSILLLILVIIDVKDARLDKIANIMLFALIIWSLFCTLEVLNDTCDLGIQAGAWYTGARMMAFQLVYAFLVFSFYITTPNKLLQYLFLWGGLSLFAVFWIWKQSNFGFTDAENAWVQTRGRTTHILNAGTLTRYFSTFSDAASAGINLASTAAAFIIFGISSKVKKYRYIFLGIGLACAWGMFPTGTRTAIFCFLAGFMVYTILSKSVKLTVIIGSIGLFVFFFLAFTTIGNGNAQIRRMRTAFNKDDASANQRTINQAVMKKYLADAPFGIGLGMGMENVPANNKFRKLATIPPDSEYVFIWIRTGVVGITFFLITTLIMFGGASWIVMFRLKSSSLRGIGAGFCCAFVSMQLGGYGNQVLMNYPNCLIFYGGLSMVYILPFIEDEWTKHEELVLAKQEEKKRLKLEAKAAQRV